MMLARGGLGIVPAWQFSSDPAVNPNINPNVQFPPGWTQATVQPVGDFYAPPGPGAGMAGLGAIMRRGPRSGTCCDQCSCGGGDPCCMGGMQRRFGFSDSVISPVTDAVSDTSWVVRHRKALVFGGLAALGFAAYGIGKAFFG